MLIVNEEELRRRREDVDAFVRDKARVLTNGRIEFDDAALEGKRIAVGPLASRARRYTAPRVLLAGDAAQFVDPFTGQGVYLALRAAEFVSQAVTSVLYGDVPQAIAWRQYDARLRAELRRRNRLSSMVSLLVRLPPVAKCAAALLERRPRAFVPLLDAVTGAT
jgi:flavin-dependent dehydrogenase